MCGYLLYVGKLNNKSNFIKTSNSIRHRGPDSCNHYFDDENNINIGFHRLSIIDIKNGNQPFFSECKNIILLFNGEIYNSSELRDILENKGYKFKSINSDTETILVSYLEWSENLFSKLDGMFAITIVDLRKNIIICSRDIFGEKPLYYFIDDKKIILSSEIRVFKSFCNLMISEKELMRYFVLSHIPAPNTIYKNVYKIENSTFLKINIKDKSFVKDYYYDFSDNYKNYNSSKYSLPEFENILKDTISSRSVSDVKIGHFLSGGVDSTLLSIYLKELDIDSTSYTIGIDGQSFDESDQAKYVSNFLNIKNKNFILNKNNFLEILNESHNMIDEPFFAPSFLPTFALSRYASKDLKVVLSGDGGDEIFGGYEIFKFANIFQRINFFRSNRNYDKLIRFFPISDKNLSFEFKLRRFLRGFSVDNEVRNTFFLSPIDLKDLEDIFNKKIDLQYLFSDIYNFDKKYKYIDPYNKMTLYYLKYYLPDLVASRADRAGMYNSLEIRSPFLSKKILEYYLKLSNNYKKSIFSTKIILKNIIKKKFNKKIKIQKTGLTFPMQSWIDVNKIELTSAKFFNLNEEKINQMAFMHKNKDSEYRNFFMQFDQLNRFRNKYF